MKYLGITASVLAVVTPALSYPNYVLVPDSYYDEGSTPMADATCSHGEHGLLTHAYTTFDSLPTFPFIGAAPQITGPDSSYCGSCWELTYTDLFGISVSLNFTAIDAGKGGADAFTISWAGVEYLMGMSVEDIGFLPITVARKSPKACHLD